METENEMPAVGEPGLETVNDVAELGPTVKLPEFPVTEPCVAVMLVV
jgi:translation initiation factor 2 alpha subunit (eIF-2alpha)